jgi:hypothetical protein
LVNPILRTVRPKTELIISPLATYQARIAEIMNSQPAAWVRPAMPAICPAAINVDPPARKPRTPTSPQATPVAAMVPIQVIHARAMNQKPSATKGPEGIATVPRAIMNQRTP